MMLALYTRGREVADELHLGTLAWAAHPLACCATVELTGSGIDRSRVRNVRSEALRMDARAGARE